VEGADEGEYFDVNMPSLIHTNWQWCCLKMLLMYFWKPWSF